MITKTIFMNAEQRRALKELRRYRRNIFERFSYLIEELMFDKDQISAKKADESFALQREEKRTAAYKKRKEKIKQLKRSCRDIGIPDWIIKTTNNQS